ncbi:hypothetical protein S40288_09671 [Stachybotrys chartarum IBT 40288]|nr:hypothetical protein S40288_09671 [Stachybotrys chartarum IBT 40288]
MPVSWLTLPVEPHSWREAPPCELTLEQFAYQSQYWRWWYEADHRYALPTVALFLVAIILFTVGNAFIIFAPAQWQQNQFLLTTGNHRILSTKANPISALTGYSHEKLIIWHNWLAWAMFALALVHTFPFIVYNIWAGDIVMQWSMGGLWPTGVIALIAQAWLTFMSIRWVRDAFYEFFKAMHFLVALVFIVFLFLHCDHVLSSWDYFIAAGVLYTLSGLYSQCRVFVEHGFKHRAELFLVSKETVKIVIKIRSPWKPGQHIYVRFLALGIHSLTFHPFKICSLPSTDGNNDMVLYVK